jgi:hypothetical protein
MRLMTNLASCSSMGIRENMYAYSEIIPFLDASTQIYPIVYQTPQSEYFYTPN